VGQDVGCDRPQNPRLADLSRISIAGIYGETRMGRPLFTCDCFNQRLGGAIENRSEGIDEASERINNNTFA
jgi:hypothetical protein